jgi:hypothetical protein
MLRQMLAVAELEAGLISERTRKALERKRVWYAGLTDEEKAELKAKGKATQLGGDRGNLPAVADKGRTISLVRRQDKAHRRAADHRGTASLRRDLIPADGHQPECEGHQDGPRRQVERGSSEAGDGADRMRDQSTCGAIIGSRLGILRTSAESHRSRSFLRRDLPGHGLTTR